MRNSFQFDVESGDVHGPGGADGSLSVTLTATAVANSTATKTATITVELPLTFTITNTQCASTGTSTQIACGSNGQPYSTTIPVTGGVAPLKFTLAPGSGSLPPGLTLNQSGTITGTPSGPVAGQPNPTVFTVQVTDDSTQPVSQQQIYSIFIAPAPTLVITAVSPLQSGLVNDTYGTLDHHARGRKAVQMELAKRRASSGSRFEHGHGSDHRRADGGEWHPLYVHRASFRLHASQPANSIEAIGDFDSGAAAAFDFACVASERYHRDSVFDLAHCQRRNTALHLANHQRPAPIRPHVLSARTPRFRELPSL